MWQNKMRGNALEPPKLCPLSLTDAAFRQNVLHAHLVVAVWRDCLKTDPPALAPTDHGWYRPEGKAFLLPVVVPAGIPLAPAELLKVLKCGCSNSTPCASKRCSCKANGLSCTLFCHCRGDDCHNK